MTADRQDGGTARRRASQTRNALNRGFAMPAARAVPAPADEPAVSQVPASTPRAEEAREEKATLSKYTALLDADTAAEFDGLALAARRKLGRKVDKSALMRALIRLAADDASLRDQVFDQLRG